MMNMIFPGYGVHMNAVNFIAEYFLVLFFFAPLENRPERAKRWAGRTLLVLLALLYFFSGDISGNLRQGTYRFADQILRMVLYFLPVYGYLRLAKAAARTQACYLGLYYVFFYEMSYIYRHIANYAAVTYFTGLKFGAILSVVGFGAGLAMEYFFAWMVHRSVPLERIITIRFFRMFFVLSMNLVSIYLKFSMMPQSVAQEAPLWNQIFYPLLAGVSMEFIMVFFESYQAMDEDRKALQLQKEMRGYELAAANKAAEADQTVRQLHHDMKNHLLAIRSMDSGKDAAAYIDSIVERLEVGDDLVSTGLPYLNAYLTQKVSALKREGIKCHIDLSLAALSYVTPVDMISVVGNGVDNAGEALRALPEEQRLLMVKSSSFANTILLQFVNSFAGELRWSSGRLATIKQNPERHGIGLKTIQRVAEKYGGTMAVKADGKQKRFHLTVMFPLPEEQAH